MTQTAEIIDRLRRLAKRREQEGNYTDAALVTEAAAALSAAARVREEDNAGEPVAFVDLRALGSLAIGRDAVDCTLYATPRSEILADAPLYTHPAHQPSGPVEALPEDDEPKTWQELAEAAIADLRRYAHDETPERRLVSVETYEERAARLSALMAGKPEQRGCPPFRFDRYINGALMAEGVTIERQSDMQSAMREAARIAPRGPNGEVPVLVLAPPTAGGGE